MSIYLFFCGGLEGFGVIGWVFALFSKSKVVELRLLLDFYKHFSSIFQAFFVFKYL